VRRWLFMVVLLAGCATGEKVTSLHEGMTPDEVIAVLGRPTGFQRAGDMSGFQYTNRLISGWNWDRADYYALFKNDRLVQWGSGDVRVETSHNFSTLVVIPLR
jgi:hypothetical protein